MESNSDAKTAGDKTLREAFEGLSSIYARMKVDKPYADKLRADIRRGLMLTKTEHRNQFETYNWIKSEGYDDSEALHIFGIICGSLGQFNERLGRSTPHTLSR